MARATYFYPFSLKSKERQERAKLVTGRDLISEHDLVVSARPAWKPEDDIGRQFGSHKQPRLYRLGLDSGPTSFDKWDDADTMTVHRHIQLLQYAKLDVVIFDVYGGIRAVNGERYFNSELIESPLKFVQILRSEKHPLKIGINICLSSPRVKLPIPDPHLQATIPELRKDYEISSESIRSLVSYMAKSFMTSDSFWEYQDQPVIFLNDAIKITRLEQSFTPLVLKRTIEEIREEVRGVTGNLPYLVGLVFKHEDALLASKMGFDAISSYILLPRFDDAREHPVQNFSDLLQETLVLWRTIVRDVPIPFYPSSVPGWDAWSRVEQGWHVDDVHGGYPATPIVVGGTPELFAHMIEQSKALILEQTAKMPKSEPLLTTLIACWNEMSEGCSILPVFDPTSRKFDTRLMEVVRTAAQPPYNGGSKGSMTEMQSWNHSADS